jgi:ceramide glucosyltransferase
MLPCPVTMALAVTAAVVAGAGLLQAAIGWWVVRRYRNMDNPVGARQPGITILKPLHGDEPMLEQALATFCAQDYPVFQVVFGLHDPADPALQVIDRLRARFPQTDITVVIDPAQHGVNRKISNLINMYPQAKHDVIVMADSDIHAPGNYLRQLASALERPGVGLVTTLYAGLEASSSLAARLGTTQINHSFLPGALIARFLGREDCLGATMALRRTMLADVGGLQALVHHLADDAVLGRLVAARGFRVALAKTLPATTVPEMRLSHLYAHELRWGRTIQSLAPVGFAFSTLQYPLFWAALAVGVSGLQPWTLAMFGLAWLGRATAVVAIDITLGLATTTPIWLLPFRDILSVTVILASYGGSKVAWRGHVMHISPPRILAVKGLTP